MQANTKLTAEQKAELKTMRVGAMQYGVTVVNLDNKTTIAYKVLGNTVEFALSVMAPTEKKFRPKVGEYFALSKFLDSQIVRMDKFDFKNMVECVYEYCGVI